MKSCNLSLVQGRPTRKGPTRSVQVVAIHSRNVGTHSFDISCQQKLAMLHLALLFNFRLSKSRPPLKMDRNVH